MHDFSGLDLNVTMAICDLASCSPAGDFDALGQIGVRANHTAFAADEVSALRGTLCRRVQDQELSLTRSISLHGLCSTDLSRGLARNSSVFACASKLYHMGINARVSRSMLADANEVRDWRIHAECAQSLIGITHLPYAAEPFGVDMKETGYALDARTVADLYRCRCMSSCFSNESSNIFVSKTSSSLRRA
jgi:hypothetical protein